MGWAYFRNGSAIDNPYYYSKAYLWDIQGLSKGHVGDMSVPAWSLSSPGIAIQV